MTNVAARYATQIIAEEEKKRFSFVHFTAHEINSFPVKLKLISGSRLAYNSQRKLLSRGYWDFQGNFDCNNAVGPVL